MNEHDLAFPAAVRPGPPAAPPNPILLVLRYLRGRMPVAVALGVLLGALGSTGGYLATRPQYASTGLVRVSPTQQVVLYKTEDNQPIPFFDSFVATQAAILSSRRIVAAAAKDPKLLTAGWPPGDEGIRELSKRLAVAPPKRGGELISVEVAGPDPGLCAVAVNAVLAAFEKIQIDEADRESLAQETALQERADTFRRQRDLALSQASDIARPFNADSLAQMISTATQNLGVVDGEVLQLEIALANLEGAAPDPSSGPPGPPADAPLDDNALRAALIASDPSFADLSARLAAKQTELDVLRRTQGSGHRSYKRAFDEFTVLQSQADRRLAEARAAAESGAAPAAVAVKSPLEETRAKLAQHKVIQERLKADVQRMTRDLENIRTYQRTAADADAIVAETTRRLDQLRVERKQSSVARIEVIQHGEMPLRPSKDRRVPLAVVGGMGGAGLGVGLVVLLGLAQGSVRYTAELEAEERARPLLGSIPDLRRSESGGVAALFVHHLRSMLEARCRREPGRATVLTITSPTSAEGKTSVASALAASFGVAGHRVLVVDADLVGRSLTTSLGLAEAAGLEEASTNGVEGSVHPTPFRNVSALPTGRMPDFEPESLSSDAFRRLIDRLRPGFDFIIIDTGPILGSLEANVACGASDHTVMVVRRGQKSRLINAAVNAVTRVRGDCIGLVFNRASMEDLERSTSSVSVGVSSVRSRQDRSGADYRPGILLEALGTPADPTKQER